MKLSYRKQFLKDLKKLKNTSSYEKIFEFCFNEFEKIESLENLNHIKPMKGYPNRYRIRFGNYRIGFEINNNQIEFFRVLHRQEFYKYFP